MWGAESVGWGDLSRGVASREESGISGNLGIHGIRVILQDCWIQTEGCRGMRNWDGGGGGGGGGDVIMDDLVGAAPGDLLEIGDESEEEGHVQMAKCNGKSERIQEAKKILTALDFMGN